MTAASDPASGVAPLSRGERMARDVMHTLQIESKPWAEIQANRPETIRSAFETLDAADDFEGMIAAQMSIVHSLFLGTAWLSLDRARPDKDKAFYLRQAGQLMRLYRQAFDSLGKRQRERRAEAERKKALRYFRSERGHAAFQRKTACLPDAEPTGADRSAGDERGLSALPRKAEGPRLTLPCAGAGTDICTERGSVRQGKDADLTPATLYPLTFPSVPHRKSHLMATAGPALAQGP
jgi:hypothetical protein